MVASTLEPERALTTASAKSNSRVVSIDALRGFTMLVLASNQLQGFSFVTISQRFPDSSLWASLARQFDHAPWQGCTIWDLIMPTFVMLIGVSLRLSYARRAAQGEQGIDIAAHVLTRSLGMFILGMLLVVRIDSNADLLWPLLLLLPGLHIGGLKAARIPERWRARLSMILWGVVLAAGAWRLASRVGALRNYDFTHLLTQVALAYPFAFAIARLSEASQRWILVAILGGYWALFAFYPVPQIDPHALGATLGVALPAWYSGFFAHWNPFVNVAAAFDVWFMNLLPRVVPFTYAEHGYQTLDFVPLIGTMVLGSLLASGFRNQGSDRQFCKQLLWQGAVLMILGWCGGQLVCPIVKSLWTPTYVLFSGGIVMMILAGFHFVATLSNRGLLMHALAVVGMNSLVVYVLSMNFRGWFLYKWHHLLDAVMSGPYVPLYESLLMVLTMWGIAALLYRARIFVRL